MKRFVSFAVKLQKNTEKDTGKDTGKDALRCASTEQKNKKHMVYAIL